MFGYFIKKLLWLIPTLIIITIISFWLFSLSNANPIDKILLKSSKSINQYQKNEQEKLKKYWTNKLGLNLPVFYFSIQTLAEPDTLYKIIDRKSKEQINSLLKQNGNYQSVILFKNELSSYKKTTAYLSENDSLFIYASIEKTVSDLEYSKDTSYLNYHLKTLVNIHQQNKINVPLTALATSIDELSKPTSTYKNYIPKIVWHGLNNRYHRWIFGTNNKGGLIRGDFGLSYTKNISVISILKPKIIISLLFSFLSIVLAYSISIPLTKKMMLLNFEKKNSKIINVCLFILFCTPTFFMGIMLLMLFANPDIISILPPSGIKPIEGYSSTLFVSNLLQTIPYIILPLVCYTYTSIVYITKTLSGSITNELEKNYIKTAQAKGLCRKEVVQHAYKNSLIPIITIFTQLFPMLIGGSIIIESIFTLPGLGTEIVQAVLSQDYPIIIAITTLTTIFTLMSYLVADVLYVFVDPRIKINA